MGGRRNAVVVMLGAVLACLFFASAGAAGTTSQIAAVRYWTAPDHTRVVVDLTAEPRYSTRVLTDPDRIVVLVLGGDVAGAPQTTPVGDGLVERIRLNQLASGAQVVVDLARSSAHNVFTLRPYLQKPHRIVIDGFREAPPEERPETPVGKHVVIIDPGHGGEDPGTTGNGKLKEKTVVLDIAKRLAEILRSRPGYDVHLTRTGDYFVRLAKRKRLAHEKHGDIFVSIHANSAPNRKASGTEVFYVSPRGASDQAARELADRENACDLVGGVSPDADEDILSVLVDLKMSDNVIKSSDLAALVADRLERSGTSDCVVKQAGFVVLKQLAMPSVLVEVGFLTNPSDVKKLSSKSYRQRYARAMADAIEAYFERYAPVVETPDGQHRVAPGETLWSIARRYNTTVEDLRRLNGLPDDATIRVDQVLIVRKT